MSYSNSSNDSYKPWIRSSLINRVKTLVSMSSLLDVLQSTLVKSVESVFIMENHRAHEMIYFRVSSHTKQGSLAIFGQNASRRVNKLKFPHICTAGSFLIGRLARRASLSPIQTRT